MNKSDFYKGLAIGFAAGGGTILLAHYIKKSRNNKIDQNRNLISSRPIPNELLVNKSTGSFYLGEVPADKNGEAYKSHGVFCGKPMRQDGNILILGGPGSGKTTGPINNTLRTWSRGNVIALDCKGGMANLWRDIHRNDGKRLFHFALYREVPACVYDAFSLMRLDPNHAVEHALDLSDSIIEITLSDRETVWKKNAQNALTSVFLYCFDEGKSFVEAVQMVNSYSLSELVNLIVKSNNKRAKAFMSKLYRASMKTLISIGIELNEILRFTLNQGIIEALTPGPDRPLIDWRQLNVSNEPFDVIIEIPGAKLKLCAPVVRLLITQLVKTLSLRKEKNYAEDDLPSTLIMLDEFPQLGNCRSVVDAFMTLRSKGVTIAVCAQSIASLEAIYGESETRAIMSACQYKMIFNAADSKSQADLSALIGTTDVAASTYSLGFNHFGTSVSEQRRPLVYPEDLACLDKPIVTSPYGVFEVQKGCLYPRSCNSAPLDKKMGNSTRDDYKQPAQVHSKIQPRHELFLNQADNFDDNTCRNGAGKGEAEKEALWDSICAYCKIPRSGKEIMGYFNIVSNTHLREVYLKPLLHQGRLRYTIPDKPRHPQQKYISATTCAHLNIEYGKQESEGKSDDN